MQSYRGGRILLIGASGQVGRALAACFPAGAIVRASHRHAGADDIRLDLGDDRAVDRVLTEVGPELVLLAGAMCNAEQCEIEADTCYRINTRGPQAVAEYARRSGACLVYFSTDHVFDGAKPEPYVETDATNPLYVYARSKERGETAIREILPDRHLIVRTGWVYGPDAARRNFTFGLVDRITAGQVVTVASDQWGCPTYTDDLAAATRFLVERGAHGIYHATGPEFVDRATLALLVCEHFGLPSASVLPRPTSELGQVARRSLRVRLDCSKLRRAGAPPFRAIADGLRALAGAHAPEGIR